MYSLMATSAQRLGEPPPLQMKVRGEQHLSLDLQEHQLHLQGQPRLSSWHSGVQSYLEQLREYSDL